MSARARLLLAKLMGIEIPECGLGNPKHSIPDPFTRAEDDYAVLEWLRGLEEKILLEKVSFKIECAFISRAEGEQIDNYVQYRVGDYARAVCEVLEPGRWTW